MKLNLLTLALACSTAAIAKHTGNMITIKNMNDTAYEKAVVEVEFVSTKRRAVHAHKGYVVFPLKKGNGSADLTKATVDFCRQKHEHYNCSEPLLAKHYSNNAKNVHEIYVRTINVGPTDMYYSARYGNGKMKGRADGSFVKSGSPKGTLARNFVIEGRNVKIAN